MKITDEILDLWLEDAKNATQGEWVWGSPPVMRWHFVSTSKGEPVVIKTSDFDSYHIVNSQPQNFIALIEDMKRIRVELKFPRDQITDGLKQDMQIRYELNERLKNENV